MSEFIFKIGDLLELQAEVITQEDHTGMLTPSMGIFVVKAKSKSCIHVFVNGDELEKTYWIPQTQFVHIKKIGCTNIVTQ